MRAGRQHVAGLNTGSNPLAVNCAGFVPFAMMSSKVDRFGHEMEIITHPGSGIADARMHWAPILGAGAHLVVGIGSQEVNWSRLSEGLAHGARFVAAFADPDFASRWGDIARDFVESLTLTVTSIAVSVVLSLPVAVGAARHLAPRTVYALCRGFIAVSRSVNEIIVAILLVAMFGFGSFAGFHKLTFATIGFMAKLMAEDIEEIDADRIDALCATGASFWHWLEFAVLSQVMPRLHIDFRESTVIGSVGAGGVGATLNTSMDRYECDIVAAIILVIIAGRRVQLGLAAQRHPMNTAAAPAAWRKRSPRAELAIFAGWVLALAFVSWCFQVMTLDTLWAFVTNAPKKGPLTSAAACCPRHGATPATCSTRCGSRSTSRRWARSSACPRVTMLLILILATVAVSEWVSARVRQHLI